MLTANEIYKLGKATVDEIRKDYYQNVESGMISRKPDKFIEDLDHMIAKLNRIKEFAFEYKKINEEVNDTPRI